MPTKALRIFLLMIALTANAWSINAQHVVRSHKTWHCHSASYLDHRVSPTKTGHKNHSELLPTIKVLLMADQHFYNLHNADGQQAHNYILGVFQKVKSIYAIEEINIDISEIIIKETPVPYDYTNLHTALESFRNDLAENYNGHIAHFLSGHPNLSGGTAFVNGLCDKRRSYGFSKLEGTETDSEQFDWDVYVLAHEIGHTLGSQHTHDCVWGPNQDQAIDACLPNEDCPDAPIPQEGGSIMSYCHSHDVGINLQLGLGQQPAQRIRQTIHTCLPTSGEVCQIPVEITSSGSYTIAEITHGYGATDNEAEHARWYRFTAPETGVMYLGSCEQGVDTRLLVHSESCSNKVLLASADDNCLSAAGLFYASEIQLGLESGQTVLIEWNDRWSSKGFTFQFYFETEDLDTLDCNNLPLPDMITTDTHHRSKSTVTYNGMMTNHADVMLQSTSGIQLENNFTLEIGTTLVSQIGDCKEN